MWKCSRCRVEKSLDNFPINRGGHLGICKKCRAEERYERVELGRRMLGGRCVTCGSQQSLEFDHVDPTTKLFNLSEALRSPEKWFAELAKCQLLCKSCHKEKSDAEKRTGMGHGTSSMYTKGRCRCVECRRWAREYSRAWRAERKRVKLCPPIPDEAIHGTAALYQYYQCRCGVCREGHRRRQKARRSAQRASEGKDALMSSWRHIFSKANAYAKTSTEMKIDQKADPAVQLEQAMEAAREQHDMLQHQAAVVIGGFKQAEARLERLHDQLDEAKAEATQALQMASSATDPVQQAQFNDAAQSYAGTIVSLQTQVEHQEQAVAEAQKQAQEAQDAIRDNSQQLQDMLNQKAELVQDLHSTQMEETLHATMSSLKSTANQAIPTLDQVRDKIEARKATQQGYSEIEAASPEHTQAVVKHAAVSAKAAGVLEQLRQQAGLPAGPQPAGALGPGTPALDGVKDTPLSTEKVN